MLFNSYEFIFVFFPVALLGFVFIGKIDCRFVIPWLALASLFFYAYWNPWFLILLLGSIIFNFFTGYFISKDKNNSKLIFIIGVLVNLVLLCFYKYTNFLISTVNAFGLYYQYQNIILPLGISFFTFTQIAYLSDTYKEKVKEYSFIDYLLFVTWFPHLIAGPVLHHKQMMPQFSSPLIYKINYESIAIGITMFSLGLFKKVILADNLAPYANRLFGDASNGELPMLEKSWFGVLAYTLQLYFDFSGYSDMAIGLSRIFNVKLPLNFNSPYKSTNIIEFWRRWHMTLSKFLRDYLYIPLGGNRKGPARRYGNLLITMLLGGLWHGAGWNYVLWGGLHGIYLVINNVWEGFGLLKQYENNRVLRFSARVLTFLSVMIAWVPFRATSIEAVKNIWFGMAGMNGTGGDSTTLFWYIIGLVIIWALPNTQEWLGKYSTAVDSEQVDLMLQWNPTKGYAIIVGLIFAVSVVYFKKNSQFLYFQF